MAAIIGLVLVGLVAVLFLAIGLLDATRGTPITHVSARGVDRGWAPTFDDPQFRRSVEVLVGSPLEHCHRIELLCNGETYDRLWADLRAARRSITMQMYYCNPGKVADTLRDVLVERARAGVTVLFLYDAFGSSLKKEYFKELKRAGVEVQAFRPLRPRKLREVMHRSHARVVVVDGQVGYTGGFGIDDKWLGDGRHEDQWRDSSVRFAGPAVLQLQAAFGACWAEATGELIAGDLLYPPTAPDDGTSSGGGGENSAAASGATVALLHAVPSVGSTRAERFFVLSIAGARRRLYIANAYFVPDDDFRRLLKAAAGRGVDVRILTAGAATDVKSVRYAARSVYTELLKAGVRVFEYRPSMMHAKTLVVDGIWSSVGTLNADNRSMAFNDESNALIVDKSFASQMEEVFRADLEHSDEIELATFRRRPLWQRVAEHGAHLLQRLL